MKPTQAQRLARIAKLARQLSNALCDERDTEQMAGFAAPELQKIAHWQTAARYEQMAGNVTTIAQTVEAQMWNTQEGRAA